MEQENYSRLYAPWRRQYHLSHSHRKEQKGCIFCGIIDSPDRDLENWVLHRDWAGIVVMNLYPYNPGHFMIIPKTHTGEYDQLPAEELCRIGQLSQLGVKLLKKWGATGINIGWNVGETGGAGIPNHLHLHLVPRFHRDTNMMTTIFKTRVYSADFDQIYWELKKLGKSIWEGKKKI